MVHAFQVTVLSVQDQLLQKQACFERGISDATTTPGADLPELEDLEEETQTPTLQLKESEFHRM